MKLTKISILSAVHNESQHIDEMIESVRAQTLPDWQLLFVDDCSSDDTPEKIRAAARRDCRVRLVSHGRKVGKVAAFNAASAAASGEFVALLAGDDRLPVNSLRDRVSAFDALPADKPAVAFFKLRTFSEEAKFDGLIVPRGERANRSGGTITMNHAVAKSAFPIPEHLSGEDIWLRHVAVAAAEVVVEDTSIVLDYRIHPGNSNPRNRPFKEMSSIMHEKNEAYLALLQVEGSVLSDNDRSTIADLWAAERLRFEGRPLSLLLDKKLSFSNRLAFASMSHPIFWALKKTFHRMLSGHRIG